MIWLLQISIILMVACSGTAVVLTRRTENQPIGISLFGLLLTIMFVVFQAPDVALSQLVIGAVGLPLMLLLAIACIKRYEREQREKTQEEPEIE